MAQQRRLQFLETTTECPVSVENAHALLIRALEDGSAHITEHFKLRTTERNFTTVDAERIIRTGKIVGEPEYCPQFENWCFAVRGKCESRTLEIRVGLDFNMDLESPVMALITGFFTQRTKI